MQRISSSLAGLAILFISMSAPMSAVAAEPVVGKPFPHLLAATDQDGKPQSLRSVMGAKGVAVLFVRSADWCPFCKGQLVDANRHLARFHALGFSMVSISVDEVSAVAAFAKEQTIGYPMLSDPKGLINEAIGIRDHQYPLGTKAFGVPKPTLYIIDSRGIVRLRYQESTFRTRPDLDAVLKDVAALKADLP